MTSFLSSKPLHLQKGHEFAKPPPKGQAHAVPVPNSAQQDRSPIYRHWRIANGLVESLDPDVRTVHEAFEQTAKRLPHQPCLGHRPWSSAKQSYGRYEWLDYETVQQRRAAFGAGLVELHAREGITGKYGIGLWCQNRPEWQITDLACMSQSLFGVSLYETLGPETIEYIINHAGLACVVTSLPHVPALLKLKPRLPTLKLIITVEPLDAAENELQDCSKKAILSALASDAGVHIFSLPEVEAIGTASGRPYNPPQPSDIVTINYTSGTTGSPKGVVLTHYNAVATMSASLSMNNIDESAVIPSYLPAAHIYQRMVEQMVFWAGARIGYFHGNVLELVDDLKVLKPTVFPSVPRLYNRFGGVIKSQTVDAPGFKGTLSRHIVQTKLANLKAKDDPSNKHLVYDRIWGKKVAAALGLERANTMISGSAPLDPGLQQFLSIVFANRFMQGYGLTESFGATLGQLPGDHKVGTCGVPLSCIEISLLSVPDMEYTVDDKPYPRGELLLRGPSVFKEYYKNEEETRKAFTDDGWFKTGDIASIDEMGRVQIIDRRKNVLKLAQGEYVSPEKIEGIYLAGCNYLASAFVHGDSLQTFLVGIFGVQPDIFAPWASKILGSNIAPTDLEAIKAACRQDKIKQAVLKDFEKCGKKKLTGFEKVKNVLLAVDPFTVDNETLTPTLKLKRPVAAKKYRAELDVLYADELERQAAPKAKL